MITIPSASAAASTLAWDSDGTAEVAAAPFNVEVTLNDFTSPQGITSRQTVGVDLTVSAPRTDVEVCDSQASLNAIGLHDSTPIAAGVPVTISSYESETVDLPVSTAGTYSIRIEGTYSTRPAYSYVACSAPIQFSTTIDIFNLPRSLPAPPSAQKVSMSSSGGHVVVASSRGRSRSVRVTWLIKDPLHRQDLRYSVCGETDYECWVDSAKLQVTKGDSLRKTSTGWIKTFDYWWYRQTPGDCISTYLNEPDASITMSVTNKDGVEIGSKTHSIYATCRL